MKKIILFTFFLLIFLPKFFNQVGAMCARCCGCQLCTGTLSCDDAEMTVGCTSFCSPQSPTPTPQQPMPTPRPLPTSIIPNPTTFPIITPTPPPENPNCYASCSCPEGPPPLYGYCTSNDCYGGLVCWNSGNGLVCTGSQCTGYSLPVAFYIFEDKNYNGIWNENEMLIDPSNSCVVNNCGGRHHFEEFTKTVGTPIFAQVKKADGSIINLITSKDKVLHPFTGDPFCAATADLCLRDELRNDENVANISSYWTSQIGSQNACCSDGTCGEHRKFSRLVREWGGMPSCCEYFHEFLYMSPASAYGVVHFGINEPGYGMLDLNLPDGWAISPASIPHLYFSSNGNRWCGYQSQWWNWYIKAIGIVQAPQIISFNGPNSLYLSQTKEFIAKFKHEYGADKIRYISLSFENQNINTNSFQSEKWPLIIGVDLNENKLHIITNGNDEEFFNLNTQGNLKYLSNSIQVNFVRILGNSSDYYQGSYLIITEKEIEAHFKITFLNNFPLNNQNSYQYNATLFVIDDYNIQDKIPETSPSNIFNLNIQGFDSYFHRMKLITFNKSANCKQLQISSPTILLSDEINFSALYEPPFNLVGLKIFKNTCENFDFDNQQNFSPPSSTSQNLNFSWTPQQIGTYSVFCLAGYQNSLCQGLCFDDINSFQCAGNDGTGQGSYLTFSVTPPGPWYKLKNATLNKYGNHDISVVQNIKKFTDDDLDDNNARTVIIGEAGIILAQNFYLPGPSYNPIPSSTKNWYVSNYGDFARYISNHFLEYAQSKKRIKKINNLNDIETNLINFIENNQILSSNIINKAPFVLIVNGEVTINENDFNTQGKSLAIIANTIKFKLNVERSKGIFIGNKIEYESSNGLKIVGNIISSQPIVLQDRSDNSRPSLFIVFSPSMYLDLLPYLSTANYKWEEKGP